MSTIKLNTTGGSGGSVALKGPASTTSNADVELTLPVDDGTSSQYLQTNGSGVLSWSTVSSTPEGTAIKSTGESGGSKYLREDGDGTCSWQTVSAAEQDASTGDYTLTSGNLVIATSGKGIDFTANTDDETGGGSVSSEVLNDYERGTWTPAIKEQGGASYTYNTQDGHYVKIGDMVHVNAYIRLSASSSTGSNDVKIQGFPFSSDNANNSITTGYLFYISDDESPKIMRVNGTEMEVMKEHEYNAALDNEMFNGGNERWVFAGWYTTA